MRWYRGGCQDAARVHLQAMPRVLHRRSTHIFEGNPNVQLVVVQPSGEDLEHLFEYIPASVEGDGRQ